MKTQTIQKFEAAATRAEDEAKSAANVEGLAREAYGAGCEAYAAGCDGADAMALLHRRERADVELEKAIAARAAADTALVEAKKALEDARSANARAAGLAELERLREFDAATRGTVLDDLAEADKLLKAAAERRATAAKRLADQTTSAERASVLARDLGVEFKSDKVPAGLLRFAARFFEIERTEFASPGDRDSAYRGLVGTATECLGVYVYPPAKDDPDPDVVARELMAGTYTDRAKRAVKERQAQHERETAARVERQRAAAAAERDAEVARDEATMVERAKARQFDESSRGARITSP